MQALYRAVEIYIAYFFSFCRKNKKYAEPILWVQRQKKIFSVFRMWNMNSRTRQKLATHPSARGAGYSEDLSAQRSASGKAALSAADGAGHRKRKRQRTVVTTEQAIGFPQSLYLFAG